MTNASHLSKDLAFAFQNLARAGKYCTVTRMTALLAVLLTLSSLIAPVAQARNFYTAKVVNNSPWDIYHLYLSPTGQDEWGPDLLGDYILYSGYNFTTPSMAAGAYDLKLVDEDGDVCIVWNVDLYRFSTWNISDSWLLGCESN
jgi:hypothetical protein